MTDEVAIELERGGAVRRITLHRPEKRNALNRAMFAALTAAFTRQPPQVERVTVLRGADPVFCAGVDLDQRDANDRRPGHSPLELLCDAIYRYPLPVVASVQGAALGGGFMVAMHCDFVIAAADAKLGNTAAQLGLAPAWQPTRRLLARAGPEVTRRILLVADPIPAARLAGAGVIQIAAPAEELNGATDLVVERLVANAPLSLAAIKATLAAEPHAERRRDRVDALIQQVQESDDAREGPSARRERREPRFSGR